MPPPTTTRRRRINTLHPKADDVARLDLLAKSYGRKSGTALRRQLLKDPRLPRLVGECCYNLRRGAFKVKESVVTRNRKKIEELSRKGRIGDKRKLITSQRGGGFLSILLPAAISLIAGLIR